MELGQNGSAGLVWFLVSFPLFLFYFLFQTPLNLFEFKFKIKFEFNPNTQPNKMMHQHECTHTLALK